ncbi:barstar family protein [Brevibacillus marinus]|jgi:ribonuclease inhibitor|uniref:barstar family protein n=1 Tax=Brevibacillus marinus TaxID=2496837 RepID=UPI000F8433F1|nr:barstar family protein [Brevibacillus marinus]
MRTVTLDGRQFDNLEQFHRLLRDKLNLPDYYGNNLDALWDCLTGWVEMPLTIEWLNFQISEAKLGNDCYRLLRLFQDAEKEIEGFRILLL